MEHYLVIKRYEVLTCAATWMHLKNIMLSESQSQKTMYYMITFIQNVETRKFTETENKFGVSF